MVRLYIVKIGGSLITKKHLTNPSLNKKNIKQLSSEIARAYSRNKFRLILINGAGSYGHVLAERYKLNEGLKNKNQIRALALTQALVNQLNANFCTALVKEGIPAFPIQASAIAVMKNKKIKSFNYLIISKILDLGLVPVLYGTPAYDEKLGCSILSGDYILSYLAKKMAADKAIFASDVDGLYVDNKLIRKLDRNQLRKLLGHISTSKNVDVTGGMKGKVNNILTLKNIECYILNGSAKDRLYACMSSNKTISTTIRL